ncbi:pyridoxamine 5'-phosphate oxidase [Cryobacterium suzukii]|uniref:Pyridoxamine 5'-phosphate oxidase n=1 Tax=Cryobacterium suzukii TaxID=1259198 RepID=A0A4R9AEE3_9MICO|nr:pyridoxamine 5'-phosphate oxidase family protein [Cryobacterium suzukii]TFD59126.1 pyridoxamine 5'-phosphate oxidase [Cryobacterium suzukii]
MSESLRHRLRALPDFPDHLPFFDLTRTPADPVALFLQWFEHALAAGVPQPHAFSLATATVHGVISSRMLILKDIQAAPGPAAASSGSAPSAATEADALPPQPAAWHFASMCTSRKGEELNGNPRAAMNFYWPQVGRQVRLVGAVTTLDAAASALAWAERPGADGHENPQWQLYALHPTEIEFWQASADRHHIRHRYEL